MDTEETSIQDKIIHTLEEDDIQENNAFSPSFDIIQDIEVTFDEINTNENTSEENEALDEDMESIFEMIPTSDIIKNIEVVYDEVLSSISDEEFIINTIDEEKEEVLEKPIEPYKQMALTFDFPISDEDSMEVELSDEIKEIEVVDEVEIQVESNEATRHDLGEFLEESSELNLEIESEVKPIEEDIDLQFELKTIVKKEVISKLEGNDKIINDEIISPLNASIEEFKKTTEARKMHLKKHNYTFHKNPSNIDEIEKEPAYKRQKIELDDTPSSADNSQSRTTIDMDENDGIQLRSNNSFLHDNVD